MLIKTRFMPRFCDTDAAGHINNTSVTQWLEAGRMDLYNHHMPPGVLTMIRRIEVNFNAEMNHLDEVTIRTGVEKMGNSSVTLIQEVWQGASCRASARVVEVFFDPETRGAIPIPGIYREGYESFMSSDSSSE